MFAIVDRTNLTIDPTNQGQPGPVPFFVPSFSSVSGPGVQLIDVPNISGIYETTPWLIKKNDFLVVDVGQNQETIQVTDARPLQPGDPPANKGPFVIQAQFTCAHATRFALSNAMLGNPGPQPRFDLRQPPYQGVVRYWSIIE
jgi:hypothetical protein